MEDVIFTLFGTLILTLAGFVVPIVTVSLSAFPEGVRALKQRYENEARQAEQNLADEIKRQKEAKNVDEGVLIKNIKALKATKNKARRRLFYLDPLNILSRSGLALGVSFVFFLLSLNILDANLDCAAAASLISIGTLIGALIVLANSISVVIEASAAVQAIHKEAEDNNLALLTAIAENTKRAGDSLFVDPEKVSVWFNDSRLSQGSEHAFSVSNKHTIRLALQNSSEYMLKTAEVGFTLPQEFMVEGKPLSLYTGDVEKVARAKFEHVQANEKMFFTWDFTFLKEGVYDIPCFIKAENLRMKNVKFKIRVVA